MVIRCTSPSKLANQREKPEGAKEDKLKKRTEHHRMCVWDTTIMEDVEGQAKALSATASNGGGNG